MEAKGTERSEELAEESAVDEQCAEILRAVHEERPLRDVFELGEGFLAEVEQRAHRLYEAGRFEMAEALIRGVSALDRDRFYPRLLLGDLLLHQGRLDDALHELERAVELDPDSLEAKLKLAESYIQCRQSEDARSLLDGVLQAADEESSSKARARVLLRRLENTPSTT